MIDAEALVMELAAYYAMMEAEGHRIVPEELNVILPGFSYAVHIAEWLVRDRPDDMPQWQHERP